MCFTAGAIGRHGRGALALVASGVRSIRAVNILSVISLRTPDCAVGEGGPERVSYTNTREGVQSRRHASAARVVFLARRLDTDYPSARARGRAEGLDADAAHVLRRGSCRRVLHRSLATTNALRGDVILSTNEALCSRHVKRWRGGTMVLRCRWPPGCSKSANGGSARVQGCHQICPRWSLPSGHATLSEWGAVSR